MKKLNQKKCKICGRVLTEKSKTGLCPDCINKYGTPVAAAGAGGVMYGIRVAIKNRDKIAKGAVKIGKTIWNIVKK